MKTRSVGRGTNGMVVRVVGLGASLLSLHCGGGTEWSSDAETAAPLFTQTVHAGVEANVFLETAPGSRCTLRSPGLDELKLYSDARGVVTFFAFLEKPGATADFSLSCAGPAPARRAVAYDVRVVSVADEEEAWAPTSWLNDLPYPGRWIAPLAEDPDLVTSTRLAELGLPERPDRAQHPEAYARWLAQVSKPSLELEAGPSDAEAEADFADEHVQNATVTADHDIWSGFTTYQAKDIPSAVFGNVHGAWAVPSVAIGAGTGAYRHTLWVGIGGYFDHASIAFPQAGTGAKATCARVTGLPGFYCAGTYYAWYEYYPAFEQPIFATGFVLAAGNTVSVDVGMVDSAGFVNPKGQTASFTIINSTTSPSVVFRKKVDVPTGMKCYADSAEWVVERPLTNGIAAPFARFPDATMSETRASVYKSDGTSGKGFSYGDDGVTSANLTMRRYEGGPILATATAGTKVSAGQRMLLHWVAAN